ncbi:MAG: SH3 domain-containing protein [Chloroflexi bacterium]|nr:SH3 domain-containing protein [Chloroflexota bacterium]
MFPKRLVAIMLLFVLLVPAAAQTATTSPILTIDGDLYRIDGSAVIALTNSGYVTDAVLSPDGRLVAYADIPQVVRDVYERGGGMSGPQPNDIHVLDLEAGQVRVLTLQPDPAYYADESQPDNVFARSAPVWSPDGTGLAWTNYAFDLGAVTLGTYNLFTGELRELPLDLPELYGIPGPLRVLWLTSGFVIPAYVIDQATGLERLQIRVYSPEDGSLITAHDIEPASAEPPFVDLFVTQGDADYYAQYRADSGSWLLTDIGSGERFTTAFSPMLVSRVQPETSVRFALGELVPYERPLAGQSTTHFEAAIYDANGGIVVGSYDILFPDTEMSNVVSVSPDGQAAAYRVYNPDTRVYDSSQVFMTDRGPVAIPDGAFVDGMTWGAQMWWYPADVVLEPFEEVDVFDCPGALAPRLVTGGRAVVLPGAPNRIRGTPSISGTVVAQIPSGETFDVLGGPECADGIVWWRVSYGGATGWTAEGTDAYFVEPLR